MSDSFCKEKVKTRSKMSFYVPSHMAFIAKGLTLGFGIQFTLQTFKLSLLLTSIQPPVLYLYYMYVYFLPRIYLSHWLHSREKTLLCWQPRRSWTVLSLSLHILFVTKTVRWIVNWIESCFLSSHNSHAYLYGRTVL